MKPNGAIKSDADLMRDVAAGDKAATRALVEAHVAQIARFAGGLLNDLAEGEDVAHEALLRLWRSADDWRPEGRIGGWLRRAAYTISIDRIRKRGRLVEDPEGSVVDSAEAATPDPEDTAHGREIGQAVQAAMARLPERQRAALLMAQQDGLSGQDIAAALDVSPEAVESLLARGRRTLRRDLASLYEDLGG